MKKKKFELKIDSNTAGIDYDVQEVSDRFIDALADILTDREYHELCHQLYGSKSEYDKVDGEYEDGSISMPLKKFHCVKDTLYRGVFWKTLAKLKKIDDEKYEDDDISTISKFFG